MRRLAQSAAAIGFLCVALILVGKNSASQVSTASEKLSTYEIAVIYSELSRASNAMELTSEQTRAFNHVLLTEAQKTKAAGSDGSAGPQQKAAQLRQIRQASDANLKPILTSAQYEAWLKIRPQVREHIANKSSNEQRTMPNSTEWTKRFLKAGEGPAVAPLRQYYADVVSPYFNMPSARWETIEEDKRKYFERYPTIHYTLIGQPLVRSSTATTAILEFDMQYSAARQDGRIMEGMNHLVLEMRDIDGQWKIAGAVERKVK